MIFHYNSELNIAFLREKFVTNSQNGDSIITRECEEGGVIRNVNSFNLSCNTNETFILFFAVF